MLFTVSARKWRAVREGETHAASKTSTSNTPESFIVGVGASGALLASAAIVFVTLVGLVSFNVWPKGSEGTVNHNVELSSATPGNSASAAPAPVSAAAGQVASTSVPVGTAGSGGNAGGNSGGNSGQGGGAKGGQPKAGATIPPTTTTPPSTIGSGDVGSGSTPGTANKDPVNPVDPAHPDTPHQNISDGTNGKGDPNPGNGSDDVVHGKGPLGRPVPPTNSSGHSGFSVSSNTSESGRGHGTPSPGTDPSTQQYGLGGVIGGLGRTLNTDLQSLAGSH